MIVAPRIFAHVGLQVPSGYGVINSADSAFEQRPESFERVHVHVAFDINLGRVMDALMLKAQSLSGS